MGRQGGCRMREVEASEKRGGRYRGIDREENGRWRVSAWG